MFVSIACASVKKQKKKPTNYSFAIFNICKTWKKKKGNETIFREADREQEVRQRLPAERLANGVNFVFFGLEADSHCLLSAQTQRGAETRC